MTVYTFLSRYIIYNAVYALYILIYPQNYSMEMNKMKILNANCESKYV